ncbi:MAG: hypothetical protein K6E49_10270 [Lachnospiraceae bacterium]|nr:hypothetical protein [Lachnospiraceae bacterium]
MIDQDGVKLLYEAFFAIAESYTSIVYMDTTDDRTYVIRLDDYSIRYEERLKEHPVFREIMKMYVNDMVYRDDAPALMQFSDKEYVLDRLKKENTLRFIYRAVHGDKMVYYRLKIVPVEDGKKLLYCFENIDDQYRKQLEVKAESDRQMILLDGLSREYMSVWFLDGKSRKISLIRNNGSESENGEPVRIGNTLVDYHFSMQKYFGEFARPEDFERLMRETGYETLEKNAGEDDLYIVNYIRINPDGSLSHFQACYAKIVDGSGVANFVFGFRCIDSAMK